MKMNKALALSAALLLTTPAIPQPAKNESPPNFFQPMGSWRVDSTNAECHLSREFASGSKTLTFMVIQGAGPANYDAVLAGTATPKLPKRSQLVLQLQSQATSHTIEVNSDSVPRKAARFIGWTDADASHLSNLQSSQHLVFSGANSFAITLDLKGIRSAINALRTCHDELLQIWGVDVEAAKKLRALPKPDVIGAGGNPGTVIAQRIDLSKQHIPAGSWVSYNDYPSEALRKEIGGTVVMALSVNSAGAVDGCRVVISSKFEPLDRASCKTLTERAKYIPAQSAEGNAVQATVIERIRWRLP